MVRNLMIDRRGRRRRRRDGRLLGGCGAGQQHRGGQGGQCDLHRGHVLRLKRHPETLPNVIVNGDEDQRRSASRPIFVRRVSSRFKR